MLSILFCIYFLLKVFKIHYYNKFIFYFFNVVHLFIASISVLLIDGYFFELLHVVESSDALYAYTIIIFLINLYIFVFVCETSDK